MCWYAMSWHVKYLIVLICMLISSRADPREHAASLTVNSSLASAGSSAGLRVDTRVSLSGCGRASIYAGCEQTSMHCIMPMRMRAAYACCIRVHERTYSLASGRKRADASSTDGPVSLWGGPYKPAALKIPVLAGRKGSVGSTRQAAGKRRKCSDGWLDGWMDGWH